MVYCPLTVNGDYPNKCFNTSCAWWISGKGCAVVVLAKCADAIKKITEERDKG